MIIGDRQLSRQPLVYFVGLSAKPNCGHLAPETRTGCIVERIIQHLPSVKVVRTNLVRIPPVDRAGNLRYPSLTEMQTGWNELLHETDRTFPSLLVTLGQQVSFFMRSRMGVQPPKPVLPPDFSHEAYLAQSQSNILSVHHPSFVYVYRRRDIESYVDSVAVSISALVGCRSVGHA